MSKKSSKDIASTGSKTSRKEGRANSMDAYVGGRLRMRRTLLGMSQEKLAEALGITFQQVQKYERGVNRVGASRLYDLSKVLDVPVSFFFEGSNNNSKPASKKTKMKMGVASGRDEYETEDFTDRETLELVRAFKSIGNQDMRKSVLDMIRSLAKKTGTE